MHTRARILTRSQVFGVHPLVRLFLRSLPTHSAQIARCALKIISLSPQRDASGMKCPRFEAIDDKLKMFVIFANRTGFRRILWHLSAQSLKARLHYVSPRSLDGDPRRVHGDDPFGLTRHLRNLAIRIHRELKAFLLQRRFVAAIFAANLLDVLHREVLAELAK